MRAKTSRKSKLNRKKIMIDKKLRLLIIVFSALILTAASILLFITLKYNKYINEKVSVYSYSNKASINYTVNLIPNQLYQQTSLGEGGTYISQYIDKINTTFKYQFTGERKADINGKYSVTATLSGLVKNDKETKTIWTRDYVLQPETSFSASDKQAGVSMELPVTLTEYNNFVQQAIKNTSVDFSSILTIKWDISVNAATDKGTINEKITPTMEIPLNTKYFEIGGDLSPEKKGSIDETNTIISPQFKNDSTLYPVLSGIFAAVLLLALLFTESVKVDPSVKKLKQIFKAHGDRIVTVNGEVTAACKNSIEVDSIENLVRISDDIGKPILYREKSCDNDIPSFFVLDNNITYILKLEDNYIPAESYKKNKMEPVTTKL